MFLSYLEIREIEIVTEILAVSLFDIVVMAMSTAGEFMTFNINRVQGSAIRSPFKITELANG